MFTSVQLPSWIIGSRIPKVSNQMSMDGAIIRMKSHPLVNGYHIYRVKDFCESGWEGDIADHPVTQYAFQDVQSFYDLVCEEVFCNENRNYLNGMSFISGRNYPILSKMSAFHSQMIFPTSTLLNFKNAIDNLDIYYQEYKTEEVCHILATFDVEDILNTLSDSQLVKGRQYLFNSHDLQFYLAILCLPFMKVACMLMYLHIKSWETDQYVSHLSVEGVLIQLYNSMDHWCHRCNRTLVNFYQLDRFEVATSLPGGEKGKKYCIHSTFQRFVDMTQYFEKVYYIAMMNHINATSSQLSWCLPKELIRSVLEFLVDDKELISRMLE